jgi:hypothetical protein
VGAGKKGQWYIDCHVIPGDEAASKGASKQ